MTAAAGARGPQLRAARGRENTRRGLALLAHLPAAVRARQHVELVRDLFDNRAADYFLARAEARQERVVAEVVNLARDAFRAAEDVVNCARAENVRALRARDQKARGDV